MSMHGHGDDLDEGEVFLDEEDIILEIPIDEEDLPDRADDDDDDDMESDGSPEEAVPVRDDSIYAFQGHSGEVYAVASSPKDPSLVATGGKDEKGFLWKIGAPHSFLELQGHRETVSTVAFSYDGKLLASGGLDGLVHIWDITCLDSVKCITLEGSEKGFEWIKWHPKEHSLIAGSEDGSVFIFMWSADEGFVPRYSYGHGGAVTCGDFTPDGKIICTGSDDGTLRVWNREIGKSIHHVKGVRYHKEGLTCLAIARDSSFVITGAQDGSVRLVTLSSGKVIPLAAQLDHTGSVECIAISQSQRFVATGGMDMKLIIWDRERSAIRCICEHEEGVICLAWLGASDQYVASGCIDGNVRIWDVLSEKCVKIFSGHTDAIQSLTINRDGRFLVSVSTDGTARVFDISGF